MKAFTREICSYLSSKEDVPSYLRVIMTTGIIDDNLFDIPMAKTENKSNNISKSTTNADISQSSELLALPKKNYQQMINLNNMKGL